MRIYYNSFGTELNKQYTTYLATREPFWPPGLNAVPTARFVLSGNRANKCSIYGYPYMQVVGGKPVKWPVDNCKDVPQCNQTQTNDSQILCEGYEGAYKLPTVVIA